MSDCFDHEADAYDQWSMGYYRLDNAYTYTGRRGSAKSGKTYSKPDPLFYHKQIVCAFIRATEYSHLIEYEGVEFWIPKKICRKVGMNGMFVHVKIFNKRYEAAIAAEAKDDWA